MARTSEVEDLKVLGFEASNDGGLNLVVRHDGSKRILAWAVQTAVYVPGERYPGFSRNVVDHQLADLRHPDRVSGIPPAASRSLRYVASTRHLERYDDHRRLEVFVPLVVYEDGSFSGDPQLAEDLFVERLTGYRRLEAQAEDLEAWLEIPVGSRSPAAARHLLAVRGYQQLRSDLSRDGLNEAIIRELTAVRAELTLRRSQIPSAYLGRTPNSKAAVDSLDLAEGAAVDGGDQVLTCAVRISTSTVYSHCGRSSTDITVRETYNYMCEPFTSIGGTESQTGTGTCVSIGEECPPIFNTVGSIYIRDEMVWKRTVSNQANEITITGWHCVEDYPGYVEIKCPCPREASQCPTWSTGSTNRPDSVDVCDTGTEECQLPEGCPTPIVLDVDGDGFVFTGVGDSVEFDIDADGQLERVTWISEAADDAFLALDRDGDGRVTSGAELFGNATPQPPVAEPNGFLALEAYDRAEEGGNGDGWITSADAIFPSLFLWRDLNHDGMTQLREAQPLAQSRIDGISLRHHETPRTDPHGNQLRWSALIEEEGARRMGAVDVVFQVVE